MAGNRTKKCILVIGMHRSGTSAIAGGLNKLGVVLGPDMMPPHKQNPKGFFENQKIISVNKRFLSDMGSSWDDIFDLPKDWQALPMARKYKEEIKSIIKEDFGDEGLFAIKDPRICILAPLWLEIFQELKIGPYFIIPVRNPFEIARSLNKRDGFPKEKSVLLWVKYMLDAEFFSRGFPRVFIKYKDLIARPEPVIEKVQAELDLRFPKGFADEKLSIESFLEPSLNHYSVDDDIGKETSFEPARSLWKRLNEWADTSGPRGLKLQSLEDLRIEFTKIREFFLSPELKKSLDENNRELQEKRRELKNIYGSPAWRIARLITFPLEMIRAAFGLVRKSKKEGAKRTGSGTF